MTIRSGSERRKKAALIGVRVDADLAALLRDRAARAGNRSRPHRSEHHTRCTPVTSAAEGHWHRARTDRSLMASTTLERATLHV